MVRFTHAGPQRIVMEAELPIGPGTHDLLVLLSREHRQTMEATVHDALLRGLDVLKAEAEKEKGSGIAEPWHGLGHRVPIEEG